MPVLARDGVPLGAAEIATGRSARRRGLLGRDRVDGVLVLEPCRQVHTFGMRFAIDVAFCAPDGRVLRVVPAMRPGRVSRVVWRARRVLEGEAGLFARWRLQPGDVVTVEPS
ncbi:MAG TPA: DUF192 domain-containing protein [Acidimicrobiia bacterium]|nr:DUF192 domain-containing protein [Acidimicrobiia bacterium]